MRPDSGTCVALLALTSALGAQSVPVTKFTMHAFSMTKGDGGALDTKEDWTANVVRMGRRRGRMDIVAGGTDEFKTGDYILFDSTDAIAVRPSTRQFFVIGDMEPPPIAELPEFGDMGPPPKAVSTMTFAVDSLGAGEMIDERPTRVWRLTTTHSSSLDPKTAPAGMAIPAMTTTVVIQNWYVDAPPMAAIWYGPDANAPHVADSVMMTLSAASRAALSRWPKDKLIVRSHEKFTSSMSDAPFPFPGFNSESTTDITGITQGVVAESFVILPDGFSEVAAPQPDGAPPGKLSASHGAKWRSVRR